MDIEGKKRFNLYSLTTDELENRHLLGTSGMHPLQERGLVVFMSVRGKFFAFLRLGGLKDAVQRVGAFRPEASGVSQR